MPFSGGTAGAHNDDMHQDSAKRDVAGGLAGLDALGDLLIPGEIIYLKRNPTDYMYLYERLTAEPVLRFLRDGVEDYRLWLRNGGAYTQLLQENMKNELNGVAGLSPQGFLSKTVFNPACEEFSTHFGATDTFWANSVSGAGVYTHFLGTNHFVSCGTGAGVIGYSRMYSQKINKFDGAFSIAQFIMTTHVVGVGGVRKTVIGLKASSVNSDLVNAVMFHCDSAGQWSAVCAGAAAHTLTNITAPSDGDLLTIVANTSIAYFFVNGVLATSIATNLPVVNLYLVGVILAEDVNVTAERVLQLDAMSWRYVPGAF